LLPDIHTVLLNAKTIVLRFSTLLLATTMPTAQENHKTPVRAFCVGTIFEYQPQKSDLEDNDA